LVKELRQNLRMGVDIARRSLYVLHEEIDTLELVLATYPKLSVPKLYGRLMDTSIEKYLGGFRSLVLRLGFSSIFKTNLRNNYHQNNQRQSNIIITNPFISLTILLFFSLIFFQHASS
jgi:hypothetical protein